MHSYKVLNNPAARFTLHARIGREAIGSEWQDICRCGWRSPVSTSDWSRDLDDEFRRHVEGRRQGRGPLYTSVNLGLVEAEALKPGRRIDIGVITPQLMASIRQLLYALTIQAKISIEVVAAVTAQAEPFATGLAAEHYMGLTVLTEDTHARGERLVLVTAVATDYQAEEMAARRAKELGFVVEDLVAVFDHESAYRPLEPVGVTIHSLFI
jgi:hypothetical protein